MKIQGVRTLPGANVWSACPVLEVELDLHDLDTDRDLPTKLARFQNDLLEGQALPEEELPLRIARAVGHGACRLQQSVERPASYVEVRRSTQQGIVLLGVEIAQEPLARGAVEIAWRLLTAPLQEPATPTAADRAHLIDLRQWIPRTVATTYWGAKQRGIPVVRLNPEYEGYLVLGHGSRQRRVRWSEPDGVSAVARMATTDKYLTKQLLESIGVPVPKGKLLGSSDDPWSAAQELGLPVAIKPYNCDLQTGVSLNLRTKEKVEAAFREALEHSSWVLVERFAPGVEHRVLVIGDQVAAVARIDPPLVVGDGKLTIRQLVDITNQDPRRGDDDQPDAPLHKMKLDEVAVGVLAAQGFTVDSVPPAGKTVLVRRDPPYISNGGNLRDLTDQIHPTTAAHAVAAAQMMQVPLAGLDVVAEDISQPLEEQQGVVIEVNANPGLWLHLAPWADKPRPVGEILAAWLFPEGNNGRIPVAALAGDLEGNVRRNLAALLTNGGVRVGTATAQELSADGRSWPAPPGSAQDRASILFRNPAVDAVLFETSRSELLAAGFASDRCDVAVLLEPIPAEGGDHYPDADFVRALANALTPAGFFVTTPAWSPDRLGVSASKVFWIAGPENADGLPAHLAAGGQALWIRGGEILLQEGKQSAEVLGPVPRKIQAGESVDFLAALAAGRALGLPSSRLAEYLRTPG